MTDVTVAPAAPNRIPADLNRLGRETGMILATVDSLAEYEMSGPSRWEGWTRGHVVTRLARNADVLRHLVTWATTGEETEVFATAQEREDAVEEGARRHYREIKRDLASACAEFAAAARALSDGIVTEEVALFGEPVPSRDLVALRISEVVLAHDDLDTLWTLEEADPDAQLDGLVEFVRRRNGLDATPPFTLRTLEGDHLDVHGGGVVVTGEREGALAWLARGRTDGVRCDGDLPHLESWPALPPAP